MKQGITMLLVAGLLATFIYLLQGSESGQREMDIPRDDPAGPGHARDEPPAAEADPVRTVLDISVHTKEELQFLLDRAEQLAMKPRPAGRDDRIVLILHGPEVEFFSTRNYDRYKDIVDQAARLDAFDIVDVKICQSMMKVQGIERDDIPSFIEQVPFGEAEIERLVGEGYVYF
jgi:hypothetical protein